MCIVYKPQIFSYRQNAQRLAEMLNNQPTNPKETLVKHVEFAARY